MSKISALGLDATGSRMAAHLIKAGEGMANAGATVLDQPVVVDENTITSRFVYAIPQFVDSIVAQLI
jgi:hypothetical protein